MITEKSGYDLFQKNNIVLLIKQRRFTGLIVGLAATFLPLMFIELYALHHTNHVFIYPVDDTFIHMEVAKNLSANSTWGINPHEYGPASSSLLYTLILFFFFKIFSLSVIFPFVINCIAGVFLIISLNNWLARQQISMKVHLVSILAVVFFTPVPVVILSGMEHTLQCLFSFLFLFKSCEYLGNRRIQEKKKINLTWEIFCYAFLVTAIRYEGIFLVGLVCAVLVFYKNFFTAIKLGAVASIPIIAFGIWSISKGGYFLPNSVLVKSNEVPLFSEGVAHFFQTVFVEKLSLIKPGITALATQRLLLLLPVVFLLFRRQLQCRLSVKLIFLLLTICTLLHLSFASTGKFYRYEAYLILCSVLLVATTMGMEMKFYSKGYLSKLFLAILFFFLFLPLILRSSAAITKAGRACINIYEQQYQMGKFIQKYYPVSAVAVNDIGAVSFFSEGYVVDLWGLGNIEIAKSRKENYWTPVFLDSFCRSKQTRIAIIYDSWFNNSFSSLWKKVATWQISNNVVCGDDIISFYALSEQEAIILRVNLQAYQHILPPTVRVSYYQ